MPRSLDKSSYLSRLAGQERSAAECRGHTLRTFHPCGLSGALVKQASFIHFGSAAEFPAACRELRLRGLVPFYGLAHEELVPEVGADLVRFDSLNTQIEPGTGSVCVEDCRNVKISCAGENLLVGLRDLVIAKPLPSGFCIDERRLEDNGKEMTLRLVYHRDDSFKPQKTADSLLFCGKPLTQWLSERSLTLNDIFPSGALTDLYAAQLFQSGTGAERLKATGVCPPTWTRGPVVSPFKAVFDRRGKFTIRRGIQGLGAIRRAEAGNRPRPERGGVFCRSSL